MLRIFGYMVELKRKAEKKGISYSFFRLSKSIDLGWLDLKISAPRNRLNQLFRRELKFFSFISNPNLKRKINAGSNSPAHISEN